MEKRPLLDIRHGDGRLVASEGKVTHYTLKGKIAAEVAIKGSVSGFAEEYVGGESFANTILQAQIDHTVAGRAGGLPPWPVARIGNKWVLRTNKYRLPASVASKLGLQVNNGGRNVQMRFVEEPGFRAFPHCHGEGAEEAQDIGIDLQARLEGSEDGRQPSPWVRYHNESSQASRIWIELHNMAGKAFRKLKATTAPALPISPRTASTFASLTSPSAVSSSSAPRMTSTAPAIASPLAESHSSTSYTTALRELEVWQFVSALQVGKKSHITITFPPRRPKGEKSKPVGADLAEAAKNYSL
jgi:hypothetical protein